MLPKISFVSKAEFERREDREKVSKLLYTTETNTNLGISPKRSPSRPRTTHIWGSPRRPQRDGQECTGRSTEVIKSEQRAQRGANRQHHSEEKYGASDFRNANITKICEWVCFLIFWLVAIGGDYFDFSDCNEEEAAIAAAEETYRGWWFSTQTIGLVAAIENKLNSVGIFRFLCFVNADFSISVHD